MRRLVLLLVLSLACAATTPPLTFRAGGIPAAQMSQTAFVVVFPESACGNCQRPAEVLPNRFAGPHWQVLVRMETGWLAAAHQIEPDSGLRLPAFGSLSELLAAGQTVSCRRESWILACGEPLEAQTTLRGDGVVLTVTDPRWLERLRVGHPSTVYLSFREHNATTLWEDSVSIKYLAP